MYTNITILGSLLADLIVMATFYMIENELLGQSNERFMERL